MGLRPACPALRKTRVRLYPARAPTPTGIRPWLPAEADRVRGWPEADRVRDRTLGANAARFGNADCRIQGMIRPMPGIPPSRPSGDATGTPVSPPDGDPVSMSLTRCPDSGSRRRAP